MRLIALALVGFLLLHTDAVFTLSRFFLTVKVFNETLCFALSLVGVHSEPSKDYHDSHSNLMSKLRCSSREENGMHSVEVEDLAPMFEKSASDLKYKQNLLKGKLPCQLGL